MRVFQAGRALVNIQNVAVTLRIRKRSSNVCTAGRPHVDLWPDSLLLVPRSSDRTYPVEKLLVHNLV